MRAGTARFIIPIPIRDKLKRIAETLSAKRCERVTMTDVLREAIENMGRKHLEVKDMDWHLQPEEMAP